MFYYRVAILTKTAQKRLLGHYLITNKANIQINQETYPAAGANHDKPGYTSLGTVCNISGNEAGEQNCEQFVSDL